MRWGGLSPPLFRLGGEFERLTFLSLALSPSPGQLAARVGASCRGRSHVTRRGAPKGPKCPPSLRAHGFAARPGAVKSRKKGGVGP